MGVGEQKKLYWDPLLWTFTGTMSDPVYRDFAVDHFEGMPGPLPNPCRDHCLTLCRDLCRGPDCSPAILICSWKHAKTSESQNHR